MTDITPRQLEIARLLYAGLPDKSIAERLGVSVKTVYSHLEALRRRLGVHNRTAAVVELVRRGVLEVQ